MVFGGAYSLWLFNRISYGNLKLQYIDHFSDINKRIFVFLPLIIGTLYLDCILKSFNIFTLKCGKSCRNYLT